MNPEIENKEQLAAVDALSKEVNSPEDQAVIDEWAKEYSPNPEQATAEEQATKKKGKIALGVDGSGVVIVGEDEAQAVRDDDSGGSGYSKGSRA